MLILTSLNNKGFEGKKAEPEWFPIPWKGVFLNSKRQDMPVFMLMGNGSTKYNIKLENFNYVLEFSLSSDLFGINIV